MTRVRFKSDSKVVQPIISPVSYGSVSGMRSLSILYTHAPQRDVFISRDTGAYKLNALIKDVQHENGPYTISKGPDQHDRASPFLRYILLQGGNKVLIILCRIAGRSGPFTASPPLALNPSYLHEGISSHVFEVAECSTLFVLWNGTKKEVAECW